jgi:hypothetical protein
MNCWEWVCWPWDGRPCADAARVIQLRLPLSNTLLETRFIAIEGVRIGEPARFTPQ